MKTALPHGAVVTPQPHAFGDLFAWLAYIPCCDGWGLFHADNSTQLLDRHKAEPEPIEDPALH